MATVRKWPPLSVATVAGFTLLASFCLQEQDRSPMTGTKPTSTLSPSHSQQTKGLSRQQLQLHAKQSFTFDEDDEDWMVAPDKRIKKHHKFLANR